MAETFYGEWFPWGDRYRIDRPQWSLWLVELRIDLLVTAVWMGSDWYESDGRTIDDVGPKRLRQVFPPGSVLPDPREVISMNRSVVLGWKHWMLLDQQESYPRWEYREDAVYLPGFLGYPVQPLQNGAFVPVPWSVVGVVK